MLNDKKLFDVVGTKLFLLLTVFLSGAVGNIYTHTGNIQFFCVIHTTTREESIS